MHVLHFDILTHIWDSIIVYSISIITLLPEYGIRKDAIITLKDEAALERNCIYVEILAQAYNRPKAVPS